MTNTAFQARGNLSRTLTYRPHLRASYYGLLAFSAVAILLVLGLSLAAYINSSESVALGILLGGALAPAILLTEAHFFVKPLAFVKIKVHQTGLTMDSPDDTVEVPFADVTAIEFSHLPYIGGWFKLKMKSGRSHRFTVVLERSEYILEMLSATNPGVVNQEDMVRYRRTAVLADHSWGRVHDKMKNRLGLAMKYWILPLLLSAIWVSVNVWHRHQEMPEALEILKTVIGMLAMNLAVGFLVTFTVSEFLIVTHGQEKISKNPNDLARDYVFERQVEKIAHVAHWILAIALTLFALSRIQI